MRFTLAVGTERGEVLTFNEYGASEYLTAVAIAREQSRHVPWTEVRDEEDEGAVRVRYQRGLPVRGQDARVWKEDKLATYRLQPSSPHLEGWEAIWP